MNEFIILIKELVIVIVIGVFDIMCCVYIVGGEKFVYFELLIFVGLIYYVMVMGLMFFGKVVERRMRKGD